ncbi:DExH-box ATP-dependent RNA helicase DExH5, mitochondrial isoform X1 [Tanacetum coccineum]
METEAKVKRHGLQLEQETSKKQKLDTEDALITKGKDEVVKEEEAKVPIIIYERVKDASSESEIGVDAIPTATKPPTIVNWKIISQSNQKAAMSLTMKEKHFQKAAYQIIRRDGSDKIYISFGAILKDFSRNDLIELYRLVIKKYGANRPAEMYDRVLWGDLKTMHVFLDMGVKLYDLDDEGISSALRYLKVTCNYEDEYQTIKGFTETLVKLPLLEKLSLYMSRWETSQSSPPLSAEIIVVAAVELLMLPEFVPPPPNHARHPSPFFNPNLIEWNWDDVIVISSNDEDDEEKDIPTGLSFILVKIAGILFWFLRVCRPLTEVQEFDIHVEFRGVDRAEFDKKIKEKEMMFHPTCLNMTNVEAKQLDNFTCGHEAWKSGGFLRGVSKYRGVAWHHHNARREAQIGRVFGNRYLYLGTYSETGCGKTTQIRQFILESNIDALCGATCSIICTQPRRISAMSVSERIATKRGERLGETVGYKVRLVGIKGIDTRLLFCTTGILLRRLLVDRNLKGVTHVIVDEIYKRGMNEDFLLIVLKELLPRRPDLLLLLMSATLDADLFSSYFGGVPLVQIPGFTHPVRTYFLEDVLEQTGYGLTAKYQIDDYGQDRAWKSNKQFIKKRKSQIASVVEEALGSVDFKNYSQQTRESMFYWNHDCMGFNFIEFLLCKICENKKPGFVLVFMTGWDDISSLKDKLQAHYLLGDTCRVFCNTPKIRVAAEY